MRAEWQGLEAALKGAAVPPVVAIIGPGQGYLLDALERFAPGTRVLALEPNPGRVAAFQARRDWDAWRTSGRLVYLTGPDFAGADQAWRLFPTGVTMAAVVVGATHVSSGNDVAAARVLRDIVFGVKANDEARQRFAPRYLINSLRNIPRIVAGFDTGSLEGAYRGVPAIVAGAGPSLDLAVDALKDARGRALLIAADTALRPLLSRGIVPQLVVSLDPSPVNARHLLSLPGCEDTWLVGESAIDPVVADVFAPRLLWFRASNHQPWPWLNGVGVAAHSLNVWGSVLTGTFDLASLAGCDPIVFVGADLSFTHGRPYARGTTYELRWMRHVADGLPLEQVWRRTLDAPDAERTVDLRGTEVATTPFLLSFKNWLIAHAAKSGRRIVNATGAGMLFGDGVEQASLRDVLPARRDELAPVSRFVRRTTTVRSETIAGHLRAARDEIASGETGPTVSQWREFSGRGFDAAAAIAALDEGIELLRTRRTPPPVTLWEPAGDGGSAIDWLFPCLPEAFARFREAAAGRTVPLDVDARIAAGQRAPLLAEACRLLEHIQEQAARPEHEQPYREPIGPRTTISRSYTWEDDFRRSIEMFEALLGAAWPGDAAPDHPYFARARTQRDSARDAEMGPSYPERTAAAHASTVLALQWLRCADLIDAPDAPSSLRVALPASDPLVARAMTGMLHDSVAAALEPPRLRRSGRLKPRVLSGTGPFDKTVVAYARGRHAICLTPHRDTSYSLDEQGTIATHCTWPRPIVDELPFGDDGAVAWGNGLSRWPAGADTPYVMYRSSPTGDVAIQELPIRPTIGAWWNGRLYWSCYPTPVPSWVGIASWAPGEEPRQELSDLTVYGFQDDHGELRLEPCRFRPLLGWEHRMFTHAWRWTPGHALTQAPHGAAGAASARATSAGWTATAHPERDLVCFEAEDGGAVAMTCYYALRLAWLGSSLLVSTAERELLLFEGMRDRLERFDAKASR